MNHMIDGDDGSHPNSPAYQGSYTTPCDKCNSTLDDDDEETYFKGQSGLDELQTKAFDKYHECLCLSCLNQDVQELKEDLEEEAKYNLSTHEEDEITRGT